MNITGFKNNANQRSFASKYFTIIHLIFQMNYYCNKDLKRKKLKHSEVSEFSIYRLYYFLIRLNLKSSNSYWRQ